MIRTGIFGGSFNPLHYGHIAVAEYFHRSGWLDEIWFVVSPQNPLKKAEDLADAEERFQQVKKALAEYPYFQVSDIEFQLPRPSYMANTLRELEKRYPEREFSLIIGGDNLDHFQQWRESDFLLKNFDILVYPRPGSRCQVPETWTRVHVFDEAPQMDIPPTQIRQAAATKAATDHKHLKISQRIARGVMGLFGWKAIDHYQDIQCCVLVIAPHTSNWDFVLSKLAGIATRRNGKFLIKKEWFFFPMNLFFKSIGGVPVDRGNHSAHLTEQMAEILPKMNATLGITPEGTRKPVRHWKRGFYHIALKAGVPILTMKLDYGHKEVRVDRMFLPTGNEQEDIQAIRESFRHVEARHPENFLLD